MEIGGIMCGVAVCLAVGFAIGWFIGKVTD